MKTLSSAQIEQLQMFSDCIVLHPQVKTIFNDFDELRLNRHFQSDQQCMLLTGDTGVGKSHLINHYKKRVFASQNYSRQSIPVLVSRISSGKGLDATLTQILMDLELFGSHQRKKRGYETDLTKKLVGQSINKTGAMACQGMYCLEEFDEYAKAWGIYHTEHNNQSHAVVN